ncbi:glycosyltransferase [Bradyrhizobium sp. 138]|uniref:glycosyltransferase n=1 Tax=Bradyrhizobium sp. 138 TaxID=2782615 RepID=UPI001FF7F0A9|nr:glycosyltransferase [Bradyrhizobium sp. 138]MCK1737103.1 glycosyltransferase [Bradyrhizobium sp. 138]
MRVLHAYKIYRPDIEGGVPAVIANLVGHSVPDVEQFVLTARRCGWGRNIEIDRTPVRAVGSFGTLFSTPMAPNYIPTLIRRARRSDIVVHHAPLPLNDAALAYGLPDRVGLIIYWHAEIVGYPRLKRVVTPMIHRVLKRADQIIVAGQRMIDHSPFLQSHRKKCIVIPFGLDAAYWNAIDSPNARRYSSRHIVSLGRLVGYKGYDVLLRALVSLDATATIIGEGPLLNGLQALANDLGVADRVRFAGRRSRDEIRQLFHSACLFAFPSVTTAEAFGLAQIEAMAAGLPIINTDLPTTVPLVARHNMEALTVPPGDPTALATALGRLLSNPALAERLGRAARTRAFSEYDQSVYRARVIEVYEHVYARRSKRAR